MSQWHLRPIYMQCCRLPDPRGLPSTPLRRGLSEVLGGLCHKVTPHSTLAAERWLRVSNLSVPELHCGISLLQTSRCFHPHLCVLLPLGCSIPSCLSLLGLPGPKPKLVPFPSQRWWSPEPGVQVAWVLLGSLFAHMHGHPSLGYRCFPCSSELCCCGGEARPTQKYLTPRFPEVPVGPTPALSHVFIYPPRPVR